MPKWLREILVDAGLCVIQKILEAHGHETTPAVPAPTPAALEK